MESIHNKTGKVFTGKLAETFARIGIATPSGGTQVKKTVKKPIKKAKKTKK
jgi:hypothetical protein